MLDTSTPLISRASSLCTFQVTAPQLIGSAVGFLVLVWYFLSSTSGHHHPHYGDDYGFGGGFGGGGMNFYWMMSCVFLGSTVWRMGGGGRPEGWSFDQVSCTHEITRAMPVLASQHLVHSPTILLQRCFITIGVTAFSNAAFLYCLFIQLGYFLAGLEKAVSIS